MDNNHYGSNGGSEYGSGSSNYGNGEYGTGSYETSQYGNTEYGTSSYGTSEYGSATGANTGSGAGNTGYENSTHTGNSYDSNRAGDAGYVNSSYADNTYESNRNGNVSGQSGQSYYQDDITYTGGQNSNNQNTYGNSGQYGGQYSGQNQYNSQGQYGGQYQNQNQYGGGQSPQYYNQQSYYEEPVSVGQWLLIKLILCIPCVSLVMTLIWAFGSEQNKTKQNYFRAQLIFMGIIVVLYIFLVIAVLAGGISTRSGI